MPLWIKPDKKVKLEDMFEFMRDHLQGTELDMSKDFGAEPFGLPIRWRPLTWEVDGVTYCHERVTVTQQTGFSFMLKCVAGYPIQLAGFFGLVLMMPHVQSICLCIVALLKHHTQ